MATATSFSEDVNLSRPLPVRLVFSALGFVFLGIGLAGFYLPVLPGTINLLIAAYFFSMSSERMYRWMMTNRIFGEQLRDYRAGLGIPRRVKIVAIVSIVLAVGSTVAFALDNPWARAGMVLLGLYGIWFILNKPTREVELERRRAAVS